MKAVAGFFDQPFYAKAIEIFWKHKSLFEGLVIMMDGFQLLMMLRGVIGTRFGDAGLRELAILGEVVAEGFIDKLMSGEQYSRYNDLLYTVDSAFHPAGGRKLSLIVDAFYRRLQYWTLPWSEPICVFCITVMDNVGDKFPFIWSTVVF